MMHAFTHAFGSMLVPLYLLMVADMHLPGVRSAALIVTIYGLVYNLGSYPAGVLADHFNRKWLLGLGLIGNALAVLAMGLTRNYDVMIGVSVAAGLCGAMYHPTANALVPAHFPKSPGMAIGVLGIGAGIGFFVGPQFAGWQAQAAHWQFDHVADWQRPLVEMGLIGILGAIIFLIFAKEARESRTKRDAHGKRREIVSVMPARMSTEEIVPGYESHEAGVHLPRWLFWRVVGIASVLGFRDFAGVAAFSLASIYLQKAHAYTAKQAGLAIGIMMLVGVVVNPVSVYISSGQRRLRMLWAVLVAGGLLLATVPLWSVLGGVPALCLFSCCQLGSYAMSDAAILERVDPESRGRVVGVFLTLAGTFAATSPFIVGWATDLLGDRAAHPWAYLPIFGVLGAMMIFASFSVRLIAGLSEGYRSTPSTVPIGLS